MSLFPLCVKFLIFLSFLTATEDAEQKYCISRYKIYSALLTSK
jgi:hypothetical protein